MAINTDASRRSYRPQRRAILAVTLAIIVLAGASFFILFRET